MRKILFFCAIVTSAFAQPSRQQIVNPMIDYPAFLEGATNVALLRQQRRVTEEEFLRMAKDPATIVLDARSAEKYRLLHVKGARHLSLPDMTAAELAKVIPAKSARVLIYCNNNFENEPVAFPAKVISTSLNIYTFNALYGYGYTNVYELGPLIDIRRTRLPLKGTRVEPGS